MPTGLWGILFLNVQLNGGIEFVVVTRPLPRDGGMAEETRKLPRREYTDLGLDLGGREEQVVCHASVLALAMTDETRRKWRCNPDDLHHVCKWQRKP